ncbi:DUF4259 domain-containing protein [Silvimonas iriomotensis]|uniref:DUF4259 domain-containing protein n=1 Tax=Silvimonas iriomotensis TaxID=449662 RepID=A0ABQ2PBQ9_9NEIS|nr:DUF4259 domain-containing protein [Silvimonas iriomotensis]GGP22650.1 hypothetical protein GCM10010970_26510 [Silvimonas iriomotensis]
MGAWGTRFFENDDASDWVYDLAPSGELAPVADALAAVDVDYLESPEGAVALCAAAAVAVSQGLPVAELPDSLTAWKVQVDVTAAKALVPDAIAAIERVLANGSELKELWQENEEDYPAWEKEAASLRDQLRTL